MVGIIAAGAYLQLLGRAGERQRKRPPVFGLSHNLVGMPNQNVAAVAIVGMEGAEDGAPASRRLLLFK